MIVKRNKALSSAAAMSNVGPNNSGCLNKLTLAFSGYKMETTKPFSSGRTGICRLFRRKNELQREIQDVEKESVTTRSASCCWTT